MADEKGRFAHELTTMTTSATLQVSRIDMSSREQIVNLNVYLSNVPDSSHILHNVWYAISRSALALPGTMATSVGGINPLLLSFSRSRDFSRFC